MGWGDYHTIVTNPNCNIKIENMTEAKSIPLTQIHDLLLSCRKY